MLLRIWSFPVSMTPLPRSSNNLLIRRANSAFPSFRFRCASELGCHSVSADDFVAILHNKVLVAAAVSAAIGQFSKPFTSAVLYGKKFDLKAAVRAGGFPSTHSSAAVATATSLGLERGFSDAIFGLAVVYACLIMYDAQGVRREVGVHARELNKVILRTRFNSMSSGKDADDLIESFSRGASSSNLEDIDHVCLEEQSSFQTKPKNSSLLLRSNDRKANNPPVINSSSVVSDVNRQQESMAFSHSSLKESIGHTEIEVVAGALLGFLVSFAICPYA